jgi:hypothetical protein
MSDDEVALLTARHVVLPQAAAGELTIRPAFGFAGRSVEPTRIRVDMRNDAALLFVPRDLHCKPIPFARWNPALPPTATKGQRIISCGLPGAFKGEVDLAERVIGSSKVVHFWTTILDPRDPRGDIVCDVSPNTRNLPASMGGVSGGPAFGFDARLLGINRAQIQNPLAPNLRVLPLDRVQSLVNMMQPPPALMDYTTEDWILPTIVCTLGKPGARPMLIEFMATFYRSIGSPNHPDGRIGDVTHLRVGLRGSTGTVTVAGSTWVRSRYPLNCFERFHFPSDDAPAKQQALANVARSMITSANHSVVHLSPGDAHQV